MLTQPVRYLKGVGPRGALLLKRLGIETIEDLLFYPPRRYENWNDRLPVKDLSNGKLHSDVRIRGDVIDAKIKSNRRGWSVFSATIQDESGKIDAVWFNQPFLAQSITVGKKICVSGKLEENRFHGARQILVREYIFDGPEGVPDVLPYYSLTDGITSKRLRLWMGRALEECVNGVSEILPNGLLRALHFPERRIALQQLHFPGDMAEGALSKTRFAFEEFFLLQCALLLRRFFTHDKVNGISFSISESDRLSFIDSLPFKLTGDQQKVLFEIEKDMGSTRPMNRLLQGDVGSGKTVLAVYAAYCAVRAGYQAVIMAPTEILVEQHRHSFERFLAMHDIPIVILTRETQGKTKILSELASDRPCVVIGTHALIQEKVTFGKLGLVVIDEQHRFGVIERSKLEQKGHRPDFLVMTATPIPRTLMLTIYGDLDVSVISEKPPGRPPVRTVAVTEKQRDSINAFIRKKVGEGEQVFVVCPLVVESATLDLKAAKQHVKHLQEVFPEYDVGLIHGRMKSNEKDSVMDSFRKGKIQILVATTVIEVGVDVPAASIMVIEHAERFGLSQLHQLRGRIGRGKSEAHCFLVGSSKAGDARGRMKAMTQTNDGFQLSEMDLKMRGPGELEGLRQSGLPEFRFGDFVRDLKWITLARSAAERLLQNDPVLSKSVNIPLRELVLARYGKTFRLGRLQ